ncbi:hypothetical protein [Bacillus sp. FSL W7-1334]|uniref:hypothetical protein n=1 Tax=Bacillus sp. FSL W7-1334 TaxID=2921703 RepID=UPI0030F4BAF1
MRQSSVVFNVQTCRFFKEDLYTFTLLKASFWTAVILTIIGFGREKSALTVILFGICTLAFIGLYTFSVIDYLYNPRP